MASPGEIASAAAIGGRTEAIPASYTRLLAAGLVGNILEWYDFSIYGYFAVTIGRHFFPSQNLTVSMVEAFGAFGAGFLTRPLGALVFGWIGDHHGRERALTLSIFAMALPTFLTGVLPDYARIGLLAPVLLVLLRMIQGMSVGGEFTTSIVYLVERSQSHRRGVMAACSTFGANMGVMLGSLTGVILAGVMPRDELIAWGWRVPFLLGIVIGVAGFAIRRTLGRSAAPVEGHPAPLAQTLRQQWRPITQVAGFKVFEAVGFYTIFVYLTTYFTKVVQISKYDALYINTITMCVAMILIPLAGTISDRIGRKPLMIGGAIAMLFLAFPLFGLFRDAKFASMLIGQLGLATAFAAYAGASPAAAAEAFGSRVRCTGTAVSHNVTMALLGGTAPMVVTWLIASTGSVMSPALYLMLASLISVIVVLGIRETAYGPLP
jgi:MFS transporter, MHS family, proline/betaine transporter